MTKNTLKRIIYISIVVTLLVCLVATLLWQMQSNISFFVTPSQFNNLFNCSSVNKTSDQDENQAEKPKYNPKNTDINQHINCINNINNAKNDPSKDSSNTYNNKIMQGMQNIRIGGLVSNISPCNNAQIELIKTAVSQSHISKADINYNACKSITIKDENAQVDVFFCGTMPMLMQANKGAVLRTSYVCVNNNCFLMANEALAKHDENYSPPAAH